MKTLFRGGVRVDVSDREVYLSGLPLFCGDDVELLNQIQFLIDKKRASLIVTANVDQVIDLGSKPDLCAAYESASIRTIDGMPLIWLARLKGARGVHRQTGADLLPKCAAQAELRRWRILVLGGNPSVNREAVNNLNKQFPLADIRGLQFPFVASMNDHELLPTVEALTSIGADIVFLCLGSPKQEQFFLHFQRVLPPGVYVGAGAAVDFISGNKSRAPQIVQSVGLEWLWRVIQEPRRLWRRYLVKGFGFFNVIIQSIGRRS